MKKLIIVGAAVGVVGLIACGVGAGLSGGSDDKKPNAADISLISPTPSNTPTSAVQAPVKATTPAAKPKPQPITISDEGTLIVPTEVEPGTYRATVPDDSFGCYWARLKDQEANLDSILDNGTGESGQKMTITIKRTDKYLETHGCGVWVKIR